MVPYFTKLWIVCKEHGLAYQPILLAYQWKIPLEEVDDDLQQSQDPEVEKRQMEAVRQALMRRIFAKLEGTQDSSCM
jgi:hypothetical protein